MFPASRPTSILRSACHLAVGVVVVALVGRTWFAMGVLIPVTVSGSSMAPNLAGPHQMFECDVCSHAFAVGADQSPRGGAAVCPECGLPRAWGTGVIEDGRRLVVDRMAYLWRQPRRWDVVVFRCPGSADRLCIKRVVGLPEETISLDGGDLLVNGRLVRKSLAEQRALRQLVYAGAPQGAGQSQVRLAGVTAVLPPRWRQSTRNAAPLAYGPATGSAAAPDWIHYEHLHGEPLTDDISYNQQGARIFNSMADVMLTFSARLAGEGELRITTVDGAGRRLETALDWGQRRVLVTRGEGDDESDGDDTEPVATNGVTLPESWAELTFSQFDRQLLLAIDEVVLVAVPLPDLSQEEPPAASSWAVTATIETAGRPWRTATAPPLLAIGVRGLSGEIRDLKVWRDIYYERRPGDRMGAAAVHTTDQGAGPMPAAAWQLGAGELFVLGDNASISDDSRSWLSGAGLSAKLLVGKPLAVR